MVSPTFGTTGVDWEDRLDMPRLRVERLERLKAELEKSDLGALLTFDFHNIRYMTSTHIGTWAMDKMIRFALLPRGGEPVLWDFGSAARHHQLYAPWLDEGGDLDAARCDPARGGTGSGCRRESAGRAERLRFGWTASGRGHHRTSGDVRPPGTRHRRCRRTAGLPRGASPQNA
jgi:hypothetical protein